MENTGGKNEICTNELSLFEIFAEEIPGQGRTVSITVLICIVVHHSLIYLIILFFHYLNWKRRLGEET